MRVLIATPLYPPDIGGPATDAAALVTYLEQEGITPIVHDFKSVRRYSKIVRHLVFTYRLITQDKSVSCIIAFDTVSTGLPATIAAKIRRIPLIVRVPGDYAWEQGTQRFGVKDSMEVFQNSGYGLRVEMLRAAQKFVVRNAQLVIAPSDYFSGVISQWGVSESVLHRIYLGLPPNQEAANLKEVPEGRTLFSMGRFVPWKGFLELMELMVKLPEWQLIIAGDGPERPRVEKLAEKLGVSDHVIFLGAVSHEEVLGWLRNTDAFVYNTQWESFSFQVLEALTAGTSVITTRVGSLPELVTSGKEGILCEPNDTDCFQKAVESIVNDPEVWKARRAAAKEKASTFTLEDSARKFVTLVKKVCT
jgi:glycosyltransferase involved in cell wall biosynthesis